MKWDSWRWMVSSCAAAFAVVASIAWLGLAGASSFPPDRGPAFATLAIGAVAAWVTIASTDALLYRRPGAWWRAIVVLVGVVALSESPVSVLLAMAAAPLLNPPSPLLNSIVWIVVLGGAGVAAAIALASDKLHRWEPRTWVATALVALLAVAAVIVGPRIVSLALEGDTRVLGEWYDGLFACAIGLAASLILATAWSLDHLFRARRGATAPSVDAPSSCAGSG